MRRTPLRFLLLGLALGSAAAPGAIPQKIAIAGRLTDASGVPPPDGRYYFRVDFHGPELDGGTWTEGVNFNSEETTRGYFRLEVLPPAKARWNARTSPNRMTLQFSDELPPLEIPIQSTPYALAAERAPQFVNIPLESLQPGQCASPLWQPLANDSRFGQARVLAMPFRDGGTSCDGSSEVAFFGQVAMPNVLPDQATLVLSVSRPNGAGAPGSDVGFQVSWRVIYDATPSCQGPAGVATTPASQFDSNIARVVRIPLDMTTCGSPGGTLYFYVDRTNEKQQQVDLRSVGIEFR